MQYKNNMLPLLKELITRNPFVDEVDFSKQGLTHFDPHSVDLLGRFTELKKVRLLHFLTFLVD